MVFSAVQCFVWCFACDVLWVAECSVVCELKCSVIITDLSWAEPNQCLGIQSQVVLLCAFHTFRTMMRTSPPDYHHVDIRVQ